MPEKELKKSSTNSNDVNPPRERRIFPDKRVLAKVTFLNSFNATIVVGTVPVREHVWKLSILNDVMDPILIGIEPLILVSRTTKDVILSKLPTDDGRDPIKDKPSI